MALSRANLDLVLDLDLDQTPFVQRGSIQKTVQVQGHVEVEVHDDVSLRRLKVSDFNERRPVARALS
jgi:hypothetical protein